jgi:hypothetical protein
MITQHNTMPVVLFRERTLDNAGKPLADIPENWELADTREPELLELGRGYLLILATDVMDFLDSVMLHPVEDGEQTIRAMFTPDPSCPAYRMGDLLTVAVSDAVAIAYQILVTHGEMPDQLPAAGEMCLVLRADLCQV